MLSPESDHFEYVALDKRFQHVLWSFARATI